MPFKGRTILPVSWEKINVPSTVIMCPHCRVKSHFTPTTHARGYGGETAWIVQECDNCKQLVLTIFQVTGVIGEPVAGGAYSPSLFSEPEDVFPYFRPIPDPSIPEEVAEDYSEAVLCYSAGAFDASVVISRRAIETAAILLEANPNDKLWKKIEYLGDNEVLEKSLCDLATEIRLLGNVPAAHPDKHDLLRKVDSKECKDVLDFLEAFLESVYIRPAKIEKLRMSKKKNH